MKMKDFLVKSYLYRGTSKEWQWM